MRRDGGVPPRPPLSPRARGRNERDFFSHPRPRRRPTPLQLFELLEFGPRHRVLHADGRALGPSSPLEVLRLQVKVGKAVLAVGLNVNALLVETGLEASFSGVGWYSGLAANASRLQLAGATFASSADTVFAGSWLSGELSAQMSGCGVGAAALEKARVERIKVLLEEMQKLTYLALMSAKEMTEVCVAPPSPPHTH